MKKTKEMTIKEQQFEDMKEIRGIPFCFIGQTVKSLNDGKYGTVKGATASGNLYVLWAGLKQPVNVHPHWKIEYFDENGKSCAVFNS